MEMGIEERSGMNGSAVRMESVCVRYRLAKERTRTLQEYIIHRVRGKKIEYEDFWALKDVDVELRKGESLGIIGLNGAGKSTFLKIVAGVLKPTKGSVTVEGRIAPLIELGAGFDMELTGKENIYLNASILGFSRKEINKRLDEIIEFSGISDFIHSPLKSYSAGMISRLGFSIATNVDPDILIIDEVLAVGDDHFRKKCNERMQRFKEKGTTMLLVSHNMDDIKRICDRTLWLDHGVIRTEGTPEFVIPQYQKA